MVSNRGGKVALYLRVSTVLQAQEGHGLDAQHTRLHEFDTSTPMGKALHMMRATFSALEADLAAARTREALQAAKAKGVRLGPPPLGWQKVNGEFVPTARFQLVERVYEMNRRDGQSVRAIADILNREGVHTGSGRGTWQAGNVARVVKARELATPWCPLPEWATSAA